LPPEGSGSVSRIFQLDAKDGFSKSLVDDRRAPVGAWSLEIVCGRLFRLVCALCVVCCVLCFILELCVACIVAPLVLTDDGHSAALRICLDSLPPPGRGETLTKDPGGVVVVHAVVHVDRHPGRKTTRPLPGDLVHFFDHVVVVIVVVVIHVVVHVVIHVVVHVVDIAFEFCDDGNFVDDSEF
jgi:hypothetical protein